jgi:hypothetical protein
MSTPTIFPVVYLRASAGPAAQIRHTLSLLHGGFLHKEAHVVPMVGDDFVICGGGGVIDLSRPE